MPASGQHRVEIAELRRRAADERRRADRAAALAEAYAARSAEVPERLRLVFARAAELHYRMQARQLAAARLHETYAARIEQQQAVQPWPAPPRFMAVVAETLGVPGAAAALYDQRSHTPVLVSTSDATAQAAYDLESMAGEGPATHLMAEGRPLRAAGAELAARWPRYGPAAVKLGIRAVTAVPLQVPAARLGVLCCYDARPTAKDDIMAAAVTLAGALTPMLLRAAPAASLDALIAQPAMVP
ncbi:MAG: GAF domain-containing protein [Streptosporangiaceae bacterium]|nr:GAF domain-containing protein [Streptosporangiaceae bacterium]